MDLSVTRQTISQTHYVLCISLTPNFTLVLSSAYPFWIILLSWDPMMLVYFYVFHLLEGLGTVCRISTCLPSGHVVLVRHLMTDLTSPNSLFSVWYYSGTGLYFQLVLLSRHSFTLLPLLRSCRRPSSAILLRANEQLPTSSQSGLILEYKAHAINGFQTPASSVWRFQFSFPSFLVPSPKFQLHLLFLVSVSNLPEHSI